MQWIPCPVISGSLCCSCATSPHDDEGNAHDDEPGEYGAGGGGVSGASDCGVPGST